jgi:hypothetical protein
MRKSQQLLLLGAGAAAGLTLAVVDSMPRWDDSGILAAGLFLSAGVISLAGFRRPWLLALAVGSWMTAHDMLRSQDPRMLVLLVFPLAGAYGGALTRRAVSRLWRAS